MKKKKKKMEKNLRALVLITNVRASFWLVLTATDSIFEFRLKYLSETTAEIVSFLEYNFLVLLAHYLINLVYKLGSTSQVFGYPNLHHNKQAQYKLINMNSIADYI